MKFSRSLLGEIQQLLAQNDEDAAQTILDRALESNYKEGYKHAVSNYAVWKDGEQLVGVSARPLKEVLAEIDKSQIPILY